MLSKRLALPQPYKQQMDEKIANTVKFLYDDKQTIAIYCAFNQEVDTYGLMEHWFWDKSKRIVCPKIINQKMVFIEIKSFDDLEKGTLQILTPIGETIVPKESIDLVLVPLLAFDDHFHRVGYGKGYYDRYLKDYTGLKIGLAYQFQRTESVHSDQYDIALDGIITEETLP